MESASTDNLSAHPYGFIYDLNFLTDADRAWVRSRLPDATYGKQICDEWFESMFFPAKVDWIDMPIYWDAITAFLLILFMPTLKSIRLSEYGWLVHGYRFLEMIFEKPRSVSQEQARFVMPCPGNQGFSPRFRFPVIFR